MGQHSESHPTISKTETHQPETAQNSAEHTLEEMAQDEAGRAWKRLVESSTMNLNPEAQEFIP
jgi:hypothetical protein